MSRLKELNGAHSIAEFGAPFISYMNTAGEPTDDFPAALYKSEDLIKFYHAMVRTRVLDQKAVVLQRTGRIGTYPSCLGQEAVGVAAGFALEDNDIFVPYYRDQGIQLQRGVSMTEILMFWGGDERANLYKNGVQWDFPNCIPVATQLTHAAGVASALKIRGEKRAVLVTCGDGATSRGDFYEALNLAGAWRLPLVVLVNNNRWAISVPLQKQTAAKTLAQKAVAAGIPGVQVDGNDVTALHDLISDALERARGERGPLLIEALTYRLGDHTTADDATRYRTPEELNKAWEEEPIKRLRTFLHNEGLWDEAREQELQAQCTEEVQVAIDEYMSMEPEPPEAMFDHLYAELPPAYEEQRNHLIKKSRTGE